MGVFSKLKQAFASKKDNDTYLSGLSKTRTSFSQKIRKLSLNFTGVDETFLEELMIVLLEADLGIKTAQKVVNEVENRAMDKKLKSMNEINECLVEVLLEMYEEKEDDFAYNESGPTVILMVGVNGSGKTTSTAKLANHFLKQGKTVAVVAADTFRAGAIEQLKRWADRLSIHCIMGRENGDPSAALVDGCRYAKENAIDVLICDTAGRLQNKVNLMQELSKMHKVIHKEISNQPNQVYLVLDATTGQNGISQAELFMESTNVNGIILTKLDGSAKGGIVIAINDLLKIPVKYVGLGEKVDDLKVFDPSAYLYSLCEGLDDEG